MRFRLGLLAVMMCIFLFSPIIYANDLSMEQHNTINWIHTLKILTDLVRHHVSEVTTPIVDFLKRSATPILEPIQHATRQRSAVPANLSREYAVYQSFLKNATFTPITAEHLSRDVLASLGAFPSSYMDQIPVNIRADIDANSQLYLVAEHQGDVRLLTAGQAMQSGVVYTDGQWFYLDYDRPLPDHFEWRWANLRFVNAPFVHQVGVRHRVTFAATAILGYYDRSGNFIKIHEQEVTNSVEFYDHRVVCNAVRPVSLIARYQGYTSALNFNYVYSVQSHATGRIASSNECQVKGPYIEDVYVFLPYESAPTTYQLQRGMTNANMYVPHEYTVKPGDNLTRIVNNTGMEVRIAPVAEASRIADRHIINPGQTITFPGYRHAYGFNMSQEEYELLQKLIIAEAGGEPFEGKVAVAAVVFNRVKSPFFPHTIKEVICQGRSDGWGQFDPVRVIEEFSRCEIDIKVTSELLQEASRAIAYALRGVDPTEGATYFYNPDKVRSDNWIVRNTIPKKKIGNHLFTIGKNEIR